MNSRNMSEKNHRSLFPSQSSTNISSPLPPFLSHTLPQNTSRIPHDEPRKATTTKKAKGLSQYIRGKPDRAAVQTMTQAPLQHKQAEAPIRSCLVNSRPMTLGPSTTAFKARREERQSHWAPASESRRVQLPIQRSVPLQKLELPFIEGGRHIGSRFSINTLMNAVEDVMPKTKEGFHFPHYQKDFSTSMSDEKSPVSSKIKGPYQPRSILTRTKSFYRLKRPCPSSELSRRGSEESNFSDDRPPSLDSSVKTDTSIEEDVYRTPDSGPQPLLSHHGSHLKPVREEDEKEPVDSSALGNTFEPWALKALESPSRFNQRSSSSDAGTCQSKSARLIEKLSQKGPLSPLRMNSINTSPIHRTQNPLALSSHDASPSIAPLSINKPTLNNLQTSAATSHVLTTQSTPQNLGPTLLDKSTKVHQNQSTTEGSTILVAQPWARARTQKPNRKTQLVSSLSQAKADAGKYRTLTPSFVPLSSPRRDISKKPNDVTPSRASGVRSSSTAKPLVLISPLIQGVNDNHHHHYHHQNHAFEDPRRAPSKPL